MLSTRKKGFTLIELVVVIAIIGILAAVALPRFIDLTSDADDAAIRSIANSISSSNNINFSAYLARRTKTDGSNTTTGVIDTTAGCTAAVAGALLQQGLPTGYEVSGTGTISVAQSTNCTVSKGSDTTINASYTITGAK